MALESDERGMGHITDDIGVSGGFTVLQVGLEFNQ